ncbi:ABC transporter permease, partial [Sinorhizobium meliloti]
MKMLSEPLGGTTPKQSPKAIAVALRRTTPSAWFGVAIIVLYALIAIFAPLIAPYGETEVVSSVPYGPWTQQTFLGTDQLGRD